MSISIGGISPYAAYDYIPPQPPEAVEPMEGMDFGVDDLAPAVPMQNVTVQTGEQITAVEPASESRGSNQDSFRRDHSLSQQDMREVQAAMIGFSTRRMLELQGYR